MNIIGVNRDNCTSCGECVRECPLNLFSRNGKEVLFTDTNERCLHCGHCVAVCPAEAVTYSGTESLSFPDIEAPEKIASYETLFRAMAANRSIRRFKEKPLSEEHIEALLQSLAYAPSATNSRNWEYIIITDNTKKAFFRDMVVNEFRKVLFLLKIAPLFAFILPKPVRKLITAKGAEISVHRTLEAHKQGKDPVFFGAPCILLLHAPRYGSMAGNDAGIALTYGALAAQGLGIGSCWIGFAKEAALRSRKLRKWLQLPKGHKVEGVLALGYPAVKFHKIPGRDPVKVRRM